VKGSELMIIEDLDPTALPAMSSSGTDGNHSDVRGVLTAKTLWLRNPV